MSGKKGRSMAGLPWIAAMAFFMQALDATILNTALPAIAHSLNRSPLAMQSAIISYTLTVAMLIPVSGWLADRFGTRRVFIIAVSLFTLGSLACALSSSLTELVIFRVIQGVGGAMMMPVARLALLRAYPRSELLPVLNFVTMPGLVGPILGPVLGGVVVTWASWHWIFLINIPIGVIGILYARRYMPNFTTPRRRFDITGFLLFGLSLVLFSSGIELFGEKIVATWLALAVIACNTASTVSLPALREKFAFPVVGVVPAIKPAARLTANGIVGLLATRGTVKRPYTRELIDRFANECRIEMLGSAELVELAEAKLHGEPVPLEELRRILRPWLRMQEPPDTVVLGCTHFPLLQEELQHVLPEGTRLIDSGAAIARRTAWLLEHEAPDAKSSDENKAFCMALTAETEQLLPVLHRYGFSTLEKLPL